MFALFIFVLPVFMSTQEVSSIEFMKGFGYTIDWRDLPTTTIDYEKLREDNVTVEDIANVLAKTVTNYTYVPEEIVLSHETYLDINTAPDFDIVYPSIYIGDVITARSIETLNKTNITHVLNMAEGKGDAMININETFYGNTTITYLGINVMDLKNVNISVHFDEAADFIENAVNNGGTVMIISFSGASRASTVFIAYLMIKEDVPILKAVKKVKRARWVCPNDGFQEQLVQLAKKISRDKLNEKDMKVIK